MSTTELAGIIYEKYCHSVGGKAFNGDPLPSWGEFLSDPKKQKQAQAWIDAAEAANEAVLINVLPKSEFVWVTRTGPL